MTDTPSHLTAAHHGPRHLTIPKAHSLRSAVQFNRAMLPPGGEAEILSASLKAKLDVISERITRASSDLQKRRDFYGKLEETTLLQRPDTVGQTTATNLLLAAGITRFGVLAIAIYLVQILIGLYRYNAQVAAHYFSQADALLLLGHSSTDIGDLAAKLRLTVTLGKPESSIPEKILDRIGEAVKSASEKLQRKSD